MITFVACGGCGNSEPLKRCLGCQHVFTPVQVTLEHDPAADPGKELYQDWLRADSGLRFIEWLKRRRP